MEPMVRVFVRKYLVLRELVEARDARREARRENSRVRNVGVKCRLDQVRYCG
jgi:hypothetical protein